jgi:DNA-binding response OmpR family regulator
MQGLPTILVVEDDHLIQSVVEEALKEGGFEIVIASTAEHAAELLDSAQGEYRALVTDTSILAATGLTAGRWPAVPGRSIRHSLLST